MIYRAWKGCGRTWVFARNITLQNKMTKQQRQIISEPFSVVESSMLNLVRGRVSVHWSKWLVEKHHCPKGSQRSGGVGLHCLENGLMVGKNYTYICIYIYKHTYICTYDGYISLLQDRGAEQGRWMTRTSLKCTICGHVSFRSARFYILYRCEVRDEPSPNAGHFIWGGQGAMKTRHRFPWALVNCRDRKSVVNCPNSGKRCCLWLEVDLSTKGVTRLKQVKS